MFTLSVKSKYVRPWRGTFTAKTGEGESMRVVESSRGHCLIDSPGRWELHSTDGIMHAETGSQRHAIAKLWVHDDGAWRLYGDEWCYDVQPLWYPMSLWELDDMCECDEGRVVDDPITILEVTKEGVKVERGGVTQFTWRELSELCVSNNYLINRIFTDIWHKANSIGAGEGDKLGIGP